MQAERISRNEDGADQRFYGRRHGRRLRHARRRALDLLPRYRIPIEPRSMEEGAAAIDPGGWFAAAQSIWLEIGFGSGEHLFEQARRHPKVGFIGCEPFVNGVSALLTQLEAEPLDNLRLYDDDARHLLPLLAPQSLERVFVLFPDPWPKSRHKERRFINQGNLDLISAALVEEGHLRLASDDTGLIAWMLFHATRHPSFSWSAGCARDFREPPADWVRTRYQTKAKAAGRRAYFMDFVNKGRT